MTRNTTKSSRTSRVSAIVIGITLAAVFAYQNQNFHQQREKPSASKPLAQRTDLEDRQGTSPAARNRLAQDGSTRLAPEADPWGGYAPEPAVPEPPPSEMAYPPGELLTRLSEWRTHGAESMTADDSAEIAKLLGQLGDQGEAGVPAIRSFLRARADVDYEALGVKDSIGFQSLRLALFEIVRRNGESDAELIFAQVLPSAANPPEIAALAGYLEELAPGSYRPAILGAAKSMFATAGEDGVQGRDVGPLFQVFQNYADENLVAELATVNPLWWGNYAAVALAKIPEGKGLPSLITMLEDLPSPAINLQARFTLSMLAQVAADYPDAQAPLIEAMRANKIPDALWPEFAAAAAGLEQVQIERPNPGAGAIEKQIAFAPGGNQVVYKIRHSVPNLPIEQLTHRINFIGQLLADTPNRAATEALKNMLAVLDSALNAQIESCQNGLGTDDSCSGLQGG
ncbi:MAG: hypothetical protein ACREVH_12015 [Gammaproteobacteria bacterium]